MSEEEKKDQKKHEEEKKQKEEEEKGYKINVKKSVDNTYKESVEKEKSQKETEENSQQSEESKQQGGQQTLPEVNFPMFISSLGMQAMMSLGELENPITKKKEVNLEQTKYFVDILDMLKEKTKGNLSSDEEKVMEDLLYQLKMKYVEKKK